MLPLVTEHIPNVMLAADNAGWVFWLISAINLASNTYFFYETKSVIEVNVQPLRAFTVLL
mgnify:CR=1 FL=1